MKEIKTILKKNGSAFNIDIPSEAINEENLKEGDEITLMLKKDKGNVLREMFGTFKFKRPVDEIMKEVDKDLYND